MDPSKDILKVKEGVRSLFVKVKDRRNEAFLDLLGHSRTYKPRYTNDG